MGAFRFSGLGAVLGNWPVLLDPLGNAISDEHAQLVGERAVLVMRDLANLIEDLGQHGCGAPLSPVSILLDRHGTSIR